MKQPKLRAEIARVEAALRRMRALETNLEISATVPEPLLYDHPEITATAKQRAMLLLWTHLTPEQRSEFTRQRWFTVIGSASREKYRISPLRAAREENTIGNGAVFTRLFCLGIHADAEITPREDVMLAKKIIIEKDEDLFLSTAVDQGIYPAGRFAEIVARDRL